MKPAPSTAPDGLPAANTKRWVSRRKAAVVAAVRRGVISLEEACARYQLSSEEFQSWQRLIESHGVRGLRATRIQDYRRASAGPAR
ncbi:MAG: CtrA inhibitor SciP [Pseudomonadota bacterium]